MYSSELSWTSDLISSVPNAGEDLFPSIRQLTHVVRYVGSSEAERCFSLLQRSTMSEDSLGLMTIT